MERSFVPFPLSPLGRLSGFPASSLLPSLHLILGLSGRWLAAVRATLTSETVAPRFSRSAAARTPWTQSKSSSNEAVVKEDKKRQINAYRQREQIKRGGGAGRSWACSRPCLKSSASRCDQRGGRQHERRRPVRCRSTSFITGRARRDGPMGRAGITA